MSDRCDNCGAPVSGTHIDPQAIRRGGSVYCGSWCRDEARGRSL